MALTRIVVFGSPRHLNLRLLCSAKTPIRKLLDIWPLLPIVVWDDGFEEWGTDNLWAALEHKDCICELNFLDFPTFRLDMDDLLAEMQQPFPALTALTLIPCFKEFEGLVLPPSELFLGGSAP